MTEITKIVIIIIVMMMIRCEAHFRCSSPISNVMMLLLFQMVFLIFGLLKGCICIGKINNNNNIVIRVIINIVIMILVWYEEPELNVISTKVIKNFFV